MSTHDSFCQHTLPVFVPLQLEVAACGRPGTARKRAVEARNVMAPAISRERFGLGMVATPG
jgi:hypothetical protein